ncbi:MAG: DUF503 domain-containing protein [Anaerolineales bacterium]|nr:DUF503 domain-containing protein [Anaerolineales bacterium]
MHIAALTLEFRLPGCTSLKQKRGRLKPMLAQVHNEYNVSAAEIDFHDSHTAAVVACVVVSNDSRHVQRLLSRIPEWVEKRFPDLSLIDHYIQPI